MQYHENWEWYLEYFDYLRIGRMVAEKAVEALTDQEIAIGRDIYDLGGEQYQLAPAS